MLFALQGTEVVFTFQKTKHFDAHKGGTFQPNNIDPSL